MIGKTFFTTYVGEVDVHALQLEVGGTIVAKPKNIRPPFSVVRIPSWGGGQAVDLLAIAVKAVLTSNCLPEYRVSLVLILDRITTQGIVVLCSGYPREAWHVPESGTNLVTLHPGIPFSQNHHIPTSDLFSTWLLNVTYTLASLKVNL